MVELLSEPLYILAQVLPVAWAHRPGLPWIQTVSAALCTMEHVCPLRVQTQLALQLRVVAEASATLSRGILTLAMLKWGGLDVGIALSLAQVRPHILPGAQGCERNVARSSTRVFCSLLTGYWPAVCAVGVCLGDAGGVRRLLWARLHRMGSAQWRQHPASSQGGVWGSAAARNARYHGPAG